MPIAFVTMIDTSGSRNANTNERYTGGRLRGWYVGYGSAKGGRNDDCVRHFAYSQPTHKQRQISVGFRSRSSQ